jgi:tyrosine-protein phosphatase SIW14
LQVWADIILKQMIRLLKIQVLLGIILLLSCCKSQNTVLSVRPSEWATKVEIQGLNNLYKVDQNLYRSEQPGHQEMIFLDSMGIKTVINVRQVHIDKHEAKNRSLVLVHIPINTWTISYDDVVEVLKWIMISEKPVLLHCKHGSDRTGCIVAAYRMCISGWTKEEAIREFREGGFGYHENWYPNILRLLNSINIEKLKIDIHKK